MDYVLEHDALLLCSFNIEKFDSFHGLFGSRDSSRRHDLFSHTESFVSCACTASGFHTLVIASSNGSACKFDETKYDSHTLEFYKTKYDLTDSLSLPPPLPLPLPLPLHNSGLPLNVPLRGGLATLFQLPPRPKGSLSFQLSFSLFLLSARVFFRQVCLH